MPGRLRTGKLVWIGHGCYFDLFSSNTNFIGPGSTVREYSVIQCRSGLNEPGEGFLLAVEFYRSICKNRGWGSGFNRDNCQIGVYFSVNAESHIETAGNYTSGHKTPGNKRLVTMFGLGIKLQY